MVNQFTMLRSARSQNGYWKCFSRNPRQCTTAGLLNQSFIIRSTAPRASSYATLSDHTDNPKSFGPSHVSNPVPKAQAQNDKKQKPRPIRERLAAWNEENKYMEMAEPPIDATLTGKLANSLIRPQSTGALELNVFRPQVQGMTGSLEDDNNFSRRDGEVGLDSRLPGDLVEMRQQGSRTPVFAVFLGFFGGRYHFYGSSGRWIQTIGFGSFFTVSNFASPEELRPIIAEIPNCVTPDEFDLAREEDRGPSRAVGSALIDRMNKFRLDSERVYRNNIDNLDRARALISDKKRVKYLSLFEIGDMLLPSSLKVKDVYPPHVLYAVHTSLHRDEIAFRPLSPTSDCHRKDHIFEVFPYSFTQSINRIAAMVRDYNTTRSLMTRSSSKKALERTPFGSFVDKARQAVLKNREQRPWTPYGILAPSDEPTAVEKVNWSDSDWEILGFLEWWASYDLFEPSSRFPAYGATIIRALDLYEDVSLGQATAWTFLQEVGLITPWEVPSRYAVRFPDTYIVRGGGLARRLQPGLDESLRKDVAAEYREKIKPATVFCIDGVDTVLIDDGISLERTEREDEFWIHVHAADPASGIEPKSDLSKFMELIPENIYLKGHFQAMISRPEGGAPDTEMNDLIQKYSLTNGSRALTFSAKVNSSGDILDYDIKPTLLEEVVYLSPDDVSTFCKDPVIKTGPAIEFSVGRPPVRSPRELNRPIITSQSLSSSAQEDLLILNRLAGAVKDKRLAKGAWPYFFPRPSVQVAFDSIPNELRASGKFLRPDPFIKVTNEESPQASVVGNTMVLAGEIAARWCADRGISVPYRQDSKSAQNYDQVLKYATEVIYPQIHNGVEPSMEQKSQLATLTGSIEISPTPGPYFIMGLDMYAKATSPLRRYSDLLIHWQVHAALAFEHANKTKINPAEHDLNALLPFSQADMTDAIALLHMREKMGRFVSRGERDWVLMALIRAWRFEKTAPASFRFTVTSRWRPGVVGQLDFCGLRAWMGPEGLRNLVLLKEIKVGDQFVVELADVNVHSGEIEVRTLEYLGSEEQPRL